MANLVVAAVTRAKATTVSLAPAVAQSAWLLVMRVQRPGLPPLCASRSLLSGGAICVGRGCAGPRGRAWLFTRALRRPAASWDVHSHYGALEGDYLSLLGDVYRSAGRRFVVVG